MKKLIRKIIPSSLLNWYHFFLSYLGAVFYGFPSKKMFVIGVTGTNGKTTTCNLIAQILNYCGHRTGMASTVNFRIGEKEWANETKQTMLGRFQLQKLLRQMADVGCKYAVVETSSEGILQHRHRFIDYNAVVFTNLTPEHIERHGSFEKYRAEKLKLFKAVARKKDGIGVYNLDDENVEYFLSQSINNKYGFHIISNSKTQSAKLHFKTQIFNKILEVSNIQLSVNGSDFDINDAKFHINLIGEFNIYNSAAAICVALSQNIPIGKIQEALKISKPVSGRMEVINDGQNFAAVVDYSYETKSLENALKNMKIFNPNKIFVVFGATGGGRDKWRRPIMGEIADKYADIIFVTTDDSYDEKSEDIISNILAGILKNPKRKINENVFRIIDRKEAIKEAIKMARQGDAILFAGKGGEKWMNLENGKKISWDESEIVKTEIKNLSKS